MAKISVLLVFGLIVACSCTICPDKKVQCTKRETCCKTSQGSYGCCPYPNGTCCSDGNHCCPHATTCDMEKGRCVPNPKVTNTGWTEIYETFPDQETEDWTGNEIGGGNVTESVSKKCPDGERSCPETYTCCSLVSGGYGCCPFQDGVCCGDQVHCCAKGQSCDASNRSCH